MAALGGPLIDKDAQKVCSLSGLDVQLYQKRAVELRSLIDGLDRSIDELNSAATSERRWAWSILGLKFVKASCDVAIGIFGGTLIAKSYDTANLTIDTLNGDIDALKIMQVAGQQKADAWEQALKYLGKERAAKVFGTANVLVTAASGIYDVAKAFQEARQAGDSLEKQIPGVRAMMKNFRRQIADLEQAISACEGVPLRVE